jgi:phosphopantothenoylcysteine decarboxylase/phosphopantothenate--cysteine ligase
MNVEMWQNPATQRNITQLKTDGIAVLGPDNGEQACGETGLGRMLEPQDLLMDLISSFQPKILAGKHVLVTAGATFEAIDPVRGITNLSTGKMGYAVAQAAQEMGATVTLVSPACLDAPRGVEVVSVVSAKNMLDAVMVRIANQDIFVSVAAVGDYRVSQPALQKIKKGNAGLTLELVQNPDILATVASLPRAPFCVGFAAESENLLQYAEQKRRHKKLPLLAANLVQDGFGGDENTLILLDDSGTHPLPTADKLTLARQLLQHTVSMLGIQNDHKSPAQNPR